MYPILFKYFALHRQFSLPGIGSFILETQAADLDFAHRIIHAPVPVIAFTRECTDPDKPQIKFIAREVKTDDAEAAKMLHDFSNSLKQQLDDFQNVDLPFIGLLVNSSTGLSFEPVILVNAYYPDVAANRVVRQNAEHNILVGDEIRTNTQMIDHFSDGALSKPGKDYWWIYAIILAVIAIAIILYYFLMVRPGEYV